MDLVATALTRNSPALMQQALDLFFFLSANNNNNNNSRRKPDPATFLDRILNLAVKRAKPDLVRFLLDGGSGCSVERVRVGSVGFAARDGGGKGEGEGGEGDVGDVIKVLEVLAERGWDVNGRYTDSPDPRHPDYLIYQICHSEPLIRWCLDHGAHVSNPDVETQTPLLDSVARSGNLAIFKLLLDHGAKLGRRTLHMAVCSAAGSGDEEVDRKMEIVRFLVEERGCDVDGMDVDVEKGERLGNHYGTPLNYVAHAGGNGSKGEETVVTYLLEKGANPEIKDCWGTCDAFGYAKLGNKKVFEILNQWKQQQQQQQTEKQGVP